MEKSTHFLNGKLVSEEELKISPRDLGFSRGYAVFDFLRTYQNHKPFLLERHIDRLLNSAKLIHLPVPWSREELKNWVLKTLAANPGGDEKFIKIIISGGLDGYMSPAKEPTIIITVDPRTAHPKEYYEQGMGIIAVLHERHNPAAKTSDYIEGIKQAQIAKEIGAVEPLYYSSAQVFEGSNSNVFAVIGGKLLTPKSNILNGITRGVLLEICKLNVPIEQKDFTLQELLSASEIFFTGSSKEVTPITKIDGKPVGDGKVGPITKQAMKQFEEFTTKGSW